ncbi:hypothetical protein [Streptomyces sp. RTGN2]|uniref:hypothetical protein n=1 Tax=Streptomyces sp. RTGN2 TaxID=3016525 RepID=UPI002553A135|nr:hypothetical protein [Streptomyces sp. RTGN2]
MDPQDVGLVIDFTQDADGEHERGHSVGDGVLRGAGRVGGGVPVEAAWHGSGVEELFQGLGEGQEYGSSSELADRGIFLGLEAGNVPFDVPVAPGALAGEQVGIGEGYAAHEGVPDVRGKRLGAAERAVLDGSGAFLKQFPLRCEPFVRDC